MFATAGVSKRIFIYNFENAAEAYGRDSVGQVVFLGIMNGTPTKKCPMQFFHCCKCYPADKNVISKFLAFKSFGEENIFSSRGLHADNMYGSLPRSFTCLIGIFPQQVCGAPAAQLRSRSKLSCLSYNCFHNSQLMSSDYEGVITLWDTHTAHPITEYEAHDKRVWSVDFCPSEAQLLASGSDDGKVKVSIANSTYTVLQERGTQA